MKLKRCNHCDQLKPATTEFFYRNKAQPDGFCGACKPCARAACHAFHVRRKTKLRAPSMAAWSDRFRQLTEYHFNVRADDPIARLSDLDLAYLAGLIDGEGCFSIQKTPAASRYFPILSVGMTHHPTMQWYTDKLGALLDTIPPEHDGYLPKLRARVSGKRLVALCALLVPFLITKREQAEEVVRFGETYIPQGMRKAHPEWVYRKREVIQQRIKQLNRPHVNGVCPTYVPVAGEP
ncbi:hypothetical protein M2318_003045 [Metapseudomonas resinovorans]|uniref:hypothetical protein n=1 Tax=Metapseudomonas resinovorans TaxID=53412 RepID=UPI003D1CAFC1